MTTAEAMQELRDRVVVSVMDALGEFTTEQLQVVVQMDEWRREPPYCDQPGSRWLIEMVESYLDVWR